MKFRQWRTGRSQISQGKPPARNGSRSDSGRLFDGLELGSGHDVVSLAPQRRAGLSAIRGQPRGPAHKAVFLEAPRVLFSVGGRVNLDELGRDVTHGGDGA